MYLMTMIRLGLGWQCSILMTLGASSGLDEEKRNSMKYCTIIQDVMKEP